MRIALAILLLSPLAMSQWGAGPGPGVKSYVTPPAGISFVQQAEGICSTGTTCTCSFGSAVSSGSVILVAFQRDNDLSHTTASISDTQSNTYSALSGSAHTWDNSSRYWFGWYAPNVAAGTNTVTINNGYSATGEDMVCAEYSGTNTTSPVDVVHNCATDISAGGTGWCSTPGASKSPNLDSGTATTTEATETLVGLGLKAMGWGSDTFDAGTGFTSHSPSNLRTIVEDKNVTVTGSYNATATLESGDSVPWEMTMVGLK